LEDSYGHQMGNKPPEDKRYVTLQTDSALLRGNNTHNHKEQLQPLFRCNNINTITPFFLPEIRQSLVLNFSTFFSTSPLYFLLQYNC